MCLQAAADGKNVMNFALKNISKFAAPVVDALIAFSDILDVGEFVHEALVQNTNLDIVRQMVQKLEKDDLCRVYVNSRSNSRSR